MARSSFNSVFAVCYLYERLNSLRFEATSSWDEGGGGSGVAPTGTMQPRGSKACFIEFSVVFLKATLRQGQQVPVSSGMNIRMFPLTLEGDWTAAVSKRGWVCLGGRGSGINGPTSLSHRGGVSRSRPQECLSARWWLCEVEVASGTSSSTRWTLNLAPKIAFVIEVAGTFCNQLPVGPERQKSLWFFLHKPCPLPSTLTFRPSGRSNHQTSDLKITKISNQRRATPPLDCSYCKCG